MPHVLSALEERETETLVPCLIGKCILLVYLEHPEREAGQEVPGGDEAGGGAEGETGGL